MRGLEPPQDCSYSVLSAARLPFRHIRIAKNSLGTTGLYYFRLAISVKVGGLNRLNRLTEP